MTHRCGVTLPEKSKAAHCTACCTTFTTPANFDRHRRGETDTRQCLNPTDAGLVQVQRAGYSAWGQPGLDDPAGLGARKTGGVPA